MDEFFLAATAWEDAKELAKFIGIPGAMASAGLYAIYKEWFAAAPAIKRIEASHAREIDLLNHRLKDRIEAYDNLKEEAERRLEMLRIEKDKWRDMALSNLQLAERATTVANKAADKLPEGKT